MRSAADRRTTWRQLLRAPALIAWCVFLFVQPFYVLPTGLPQPGDLLLLPLAPIVLHGWDRRLSRDGLSALKALMWFTAWVALVDYGWALLLGNWTLTGPDGMVLFPLYYVYNLLVVFLALILHRRFGELFLRVTLVVTVGVILMLVAASFVMPSTSIRGSLFFANPNQLGYHALLSACMIALAQRRLGIPALPTACALSCCAYLAVISASRSAAAGIAVLVLLLVFSNLRVILFASVAAILALQVGGPLAKGIDAYEQRLNSPQLAHLSFFEQRGYDRIVNNKQYLLLGAGEGGTSRFKETTAIGNAEIHSSAGMLVFCYGLVGVVFFGAFVWKLLRHAGMRAAMMLVPALLYTFAHQGFRFTMLWVLVALFIALKRSPQLGALRLRRKHPGASARARSPVLEAK